MPGKSNRISQFWRELKRRKVIHVIVVYATSAFVIIELVNNVYESLQLPEWTPTLVLLILIVGFPIAVIFSWIYDLTSKGIVRTESIEPSGTLPEVTIKNSIVVLPFQNMSPDKEQEFFCDGITEEIINALTHVTSLKVIARTSAFAFKGKFEDIRKIGRELNVETILEGSVRKAGNRLRITAQLIDVSDGTHFWSESYDREMKDIFRIQDEISLAIVEKLKVQLHDDEKVQMLKEHTSNLEAYNHYLKGRHYWYNNRTWDGLQKAMKCFKEAIKCDPDYALAVTGLADTYVVLVDWGYLHPIETMPRIKELLARSLKLEETNGETYISYVYVDAFFDLDWERAEETTSKALQLNPNSPSVQHFYAIYQMTLGNFIKALEHNRKARELDPLSVIFNFACGLILHMSGQFEKSVEQFRKTLLLDKNFVLVHFWSLAPLLQSGRIEEAVDGYQKMLLHNPETEKYAEEVGEAYEKNDKESFLRWIIEKGLTYDKGIYNHPYWKAVLLANLNQTDETIVQLEKVLELKSPRMPYIRVEPSFKYLKSDPRFSELLRRIGP
jgi:TolB-like protein/Tfp pilus assembly protein PilF